MVLFHRHPFYIDLETGSHTMELHLQSILSRYDDRSYLRFDRPKSRKENRAARRRRQPLTPELPFGAVPSAADTDAFLIWKWHIPYHNNGLQNHIQRKNRQPFQVVCFGSGRRTRTSDLRVMSPTSCQLLYPAMYRSMRCRGTRSIAFVSAKIRQIFESAK